MRVFKVREKKNGREYVRYKANLTKREGVNLLKLGGKFELEDIDRHGEVFFKVNRETTRGFGDPKTSFNVYDVVVRDEFKRWCRERGLSMCQVFNDFMRAVVEGAEHVGDVGGVKIVNVFYGKPRSKRKRLIWSSEFARGKEVQKNGNAYSKG